MLQNLLVVLPLSLKIELKTELKVALYNVLSKRWALTLGKCNVIRVKLCWEGNKRSILSYTAKNCSWGWANLSPEIRRADLKRLTFRHRASCILGQAFRYSPENAFYTFNQQIYFIIWYLLDRPCIIDINNIDNQLDAIITAY